MRLNTFQTYSYLKRKTMSSMITIFICNSYEESLPEITASDFCSECVWLLHIGNHMKHPVHVNKIMLEKDYRETFSYGMYMYAS